MELTEIGVKKELYKSKVMANFSRVENGVLYYTVQLESGLYEIPLRLEEEKIITINDGEDVLASFTITRPTPDMKGASFGPEVKGSDLNRWIAKAMKTDDFKRVG